MNDKSKWLELISQEPIPEPEVIPEDDALEASFPTLAKLSMRRRQEILETPLPASTADDFIPIARLIKDTAADLMRDGIKVGEAQVKPRNSHYAEIKAAMLAYQARRNQS